MEGVGEMNKRKDGRVKGRGERRRTVEDERIEEKMEKGRQGKGYGR